MNTACVHCVNLYNLFFDGHLGFGGQPPEGYHLDTPWMLPPSVTRYRALAAKGP
jgi:hypothetical protein